MSGGNKETRIPGWLWQKKCTKMSEIIESQQEELHCAQAEELQRRDQQLLHEQLFQQNSELRGAHHKSLNEMEELKKFSKFHFRHTCKTKISRGSGHYSGTYRQDTGIAKWKFLYERFERFSRCWISTHNDCRFQIFILITSPHQQHLFVGR